MIAGHGLFDLGVNMSVGDEQVEPAVIVVVCGSDGEIFAVGLEDAGSFGDIGERPVAIVVIEHGSAAGIRAGCATGLDASEVAITACARAESDSGCRIFP